MSDETKPTVAAKDVVVTLEYTLTVDGEVLDSYPVLSEQLIHR